MPAITNTNKFQRTYLIQIQGQDGSVYSIGSEDGTGPLLTLEFNVQRAAMASAQSGTFRIKNLPLDIRTAIGKDWFIRSSYRTLVVKAGYVGTPLSTIFSGQVIEAISYREEGGVDWITEIEGQDFSLVIGNTFSSWTLGSNSSPVTRDQVISRLVQDIQLNAQKQNISIGIGHIGSFNGNRYSYTANDYTWNLLQVETDRLSYIDNGKIYCLPNGESFQGDVTLISSETGLLGTPRRAQQSLSVEMIFEPSLTPGQQVYLDTNSSPQLNSLFNGTYIVTGVQQAGIISDTVSGKCKTMALLQLAGTPFVSQFGL